MNDLPRSERDRLFAEQSDAFIQKMLDASGKSDLNSIVIPSSQKPFPLQPLIIRDYRAISSAEKHEIQKDYFSDRGVAYFIVLNPNEKAVPSEHPILQIANQLKEDLNLNYPLDHPLEGHHDAVERFGPPDGTVKIYDLVKKTEGYREQGETSEMFSLHSDGLGSGGTVQTTALYMDSPPLTGGYTFFQNIPLLALKLARDDSDAFKSLFLPDAVTQIRPRGKGALKVICPVLFLNERGDPQAFFRTSSGEYQVKFRDDVPALKRAIAFLNELAEPFSPGSCFVHMTEKGHGVLIRNQVVAHGRTSFVDGSQPTQKRLLSRKWFMVSKRDATYKHVPGMFIFKDFGDLIPEQFGPELLEGEWVYDSEKDKNVRLR
jgi:hypothetical protein